MHPRSIPSRDRTASQCPIQLLALAPAFCPATGPATSSVFTSMPAAERQQHPPYIMLSGGRFGASPYPLLQTIARTSIRPQPRAFHFDLDPPPLAPTPIATGHITDGVLIPQSPANSRGRR